MAGICEIEKYFSTFHFNPLILFDQAAIAEVYYYIRNNETNIRK